MAATGDPPLTYCNAIYDAGNKTATGPYPRLGETYELGGSNTVVTGTGYVPPTSGYVTFPSTTDNTINFPPPSGISFPEIKVSGDWMPKDPLNLPITPSIEKSFRDLAAAFGQNMAKEIDDLIMNGPKPHKKEKKKMPKNEERTLYNVFVIDPEGDGVVVATLKDVVAKNPAAAEKKAIYELAANPETYERLGKDLEEYDFLVEDVADFGAIRPKKND